MIDESYEGCCLGWNRRRSGVRLHSWRGKVLIFRVTYDMDLLHGDAGTYSGRS